MAVSAGEFWVIAGPAFNLIIMLVSIDMIDKRMMSRESRREAYKEYCKVTSYFIPLPPRGQLSLQHFTAKREKDE